MSLTLEDMVWARVYATEFTRLVSEAPPFDGGSGRLACLLDAGLVASNFADEALLAMPSNKRRDGEGASRG